MGLFSPWCSLSNGRSLCSRMNSFQLVCIFLVWQTRDKDMKLSGSPFELITSSCSPAGLSPQIVACWNEPVKHSLHGHKPCASLCCHFKSWNRTWQQKKKPKCRAAVIWTAELSADNTVHYSPLCPFLRQLCRLFSNICKQACMFRAFMINYPHIITLRIVFHFMLATYISVLVLTSGFC